MQIRRGYRTELDLNNQQITACKKHAGAARWAWNWALRRKQEVYQQTGRSISAMELHRELNELKQTALPWMYEVSKAAPQESLRDLDTAMKNFFRRVQDKKSGTFKGKSGYPRFKSKKRGIGSFRLTGSIHVYEKAIDLPRLGRLRLKECGYVPMSGIHILSATVSEEAGRWYVSVQVLEEVPDPPSAQAEPIGVDLGISAMATASDGTVIANPKALRSNLICLKRLQRRLSRKKKGSKNREKARKRLARQHARVAHIRRDALHKATSKLTRARLIPEERAARQASIAASLPEPKTKVKTRKGKRQTATEGSPLSVSVAMKVKKQQAKRLLRQATEADVPLRPRILVLETLNVTGMLKYHHLAQAIADVGFTEFKRQVEYKTSWMGETLQLADRWYPSTRRCSSCGHERDIDLSERIYICLNDECRLVIDRDLNAALNLAALAR